MAPNTAAAKENRLSRLETWETASDFLLELLDPFVVVAAAVVR
jgi:hypothetical protein